MALRLNVRHSDLAVEATFRTFYNDLMAYTAPNEVVGLTPIDEPASRAVHSDEEERRRATQTTSRPTGQQRLPTERQRAQPTD